MSKLRDFVGDFTRLVSEETGEAALLSRGADLVGALVVRDDWLPAAYAVAHPDRYQQFLLHCDPLERFSVVSFVWGPGQRTPLHDHRVWGLIGVLRGAEIETRYQRDPTGRPTPGITEAMHPGDVSRLSPAAGDLHVVANAFADQVSVAIHVYGANIGAVRRATFDPETGAEKLFISGYANATLPNLWDRSADPHDRVVSSGSSTPLK